MSGKFAVITGASGGIGKSLCFLLASKGWNLLLLDRALLKSLTLRESLKKNFPNSEIESFQIDLSDHASICSVTRAILQKYPTIHALFNNAGVLLGEELYSKHGNEMHLEVNALAPYLLMQKLRPALAKSKRAVVINTSSAASRGVVKLDLLELDKPKRFRRLFGSYAQSKMVLNLLTMALADDYENEGILLRSVCPGGNRTDMTKGPGMPRLLKLLRPILFKAPEKGARKLIDALLGPQFKDQTGIYIENGQVTQLRKVLIDNEKLTELLRFCDSKLFQFVTENLRT